MKILAISHSCVVSEYQKRMEEVASYRDVELTLLVPRCWFQYNTKVTLEKDSGVRYRILSVQPMTWGFRKHTLWNVTHVYPGIRKILKRIEPDIIELWEEPFSAVAAHTIFWARRILRQYRIIFFSAQNVLKNYPLPFSIFEKYTFENAQYAFLMNKDVIDVIKSKGYRKNFSVLPLGVDTEIFYRKDVSGLRSELGLDNFVIGFIGKLTRQKGILELIKVLSQMNGQFQLLIIGTGELLHEVRNSLIQNHLKKRTVQISGVPHGEIPNYLNCMDLLVLPSITVSHLKEQFGRVLIEAMACQVPVIGSNSGEIPKILEDAGIVFKENDLADLRRKIALLMRDEELRKTIGRKGYQKVMNKYTWQVIAANQYRVYKKLMKETSL